MRRAARASAFAAIATPTTSPVTTRSLTNRTAHRSRPRSNAVTASVSVSDDRSEIQHQHVDGRGQAVDHDAFEVRDRAPVERAADCVRRSANIVTPDRARSGRRRVMR